MSGADRAGAAGDRLRRRGAGGAESGRGWRGAAGLRETLRETTCAQVAVGDGARRGAGSGVSEPGTRTIWEFIDLIQECCSSRYFRGKS